MRFFQLLICPFVLAAWITPTAAATNTPQPNPGDRLAYISAGKLYAGFLKPTAVPHSAQASHPAFSHDGNWLAFVHRANSPSAHRQLWVMPADGSKLPTAVVDRVASFQWSPTDDVLAMQRATAKRYSPVLLLSAGGKAHFLPGRLSGDFAWSPDGQSLAVVNMSAAGYAQLALVRGNKVNSRRLPRAQLHDPVFLAGWWPDSSAILYWLDPFGSSSIIADGARLLTYDVRSHKARAISFTLPYRDWIAPSGNRLLVVSGTGRSAFFGKRLQLCGATSTCAILPERRSGHISFDPAWSPNGGAMAFVAAPTWKTFGYQSSSAYRKWLNAHVLWTANADGSNEQPAGREVPKGVQDPVWTRDGRGILFVKDGSLWLDPHFGVANPRPIARLVPPGTLPNYNNPAFSGWYYGHMNWRELFAWY